MVETFSFQPRAFFAEKNFVTASRGVVIVDVVVVGIDVVDGVVGQKV